jgi:hypothetical protein
MSELSKSVIEVYKQRGWSLNWDSRLAYQALESAEFIEARENDCGSENDATICGRGSRAQRQDRCGNCRLHL